MVELRGTRMKTTQRKPLIDQLLGEWWVDAGVALFIVGMVAMSAFQ